MPEQQCTECGTPARKFSRGLCPNCYARWWKAQKRAGLEVRRPTLLERFQKNLAEQANGCVHWTGMVSKQGYGRISVNGVLAPAHRVAYEMSVGPIPEGANIDHVCHNRDLSCKGGNSCKHRRCVNPRHLEPVTILENLRRSPNAPYGNPPKTECSRGHALTDDNVYVLRSGARKCKRCAQTLSKARYAAKHPKQVRQFCSKGHLMTDENTYHYGNRRICRQCRRDADKAAYWSRRKKA